MAGRSGALVAVSAAAVLLHAAPAAAVPIQYYFKVSPREAKLDAGGKETDVYRIAPGEAIALVAKGPGVLRAYYYQDYMPGKPFPTGIRILVSVQGKGGKAYDINPKPLRGMRYLTRSIAETPTAPDPFNVVVPAEDTGVTIRLAAGASFGGSINFPGAERISPPGGELELPALAMEPEEPSLDLGLPPLEPAAPTKVARAEPEPSLDLGLDLPPLEPTPPPAKVAKAPPPPEPSLDLSLDLPPLEPAAPVAKAAPPPPSMDLDLPPLEPEAEPGLADLAPIAPVAPAKPTPGKPGKPEPAKVAAAPTGTRTRPIEATRVEEKPRPQAVVSAPPPPPPIPEPPHIWAYRANAKVAYMLPRGQAAPTPAYTLEVTYKYMDRVRLGAEAGYNLFASSTTQTVIGRGRGQVVQANHAVPLFAVAAYDLPNVLGLAPYAAVGVGGLFTLANVRAFSLPNRIELTVAPAAQVALGVRSFFLKGGVVLEVRHQEAFAWLSKQALGAQGLMSATMFAAGYAVEF